MFFFKKKEIAKPYPFVTECVFCFQKNTLHIFNDKVTEQQWHFCSHCRYTGDNLDLLARYNDTSIFAVLKELEAAGYRYGDFASPQSFLQRIRRRTTKFAAFLKESSEYYFKDVPEVSELSLFKKFLLKEKRCPDLDWLRYCGEQIYLTLNKSLNTYYKSLDVPANTAYFVFPFAIAPRRYVGFYLVGRNRKALKTTSRYCALFKHINEAGLWGLDSVIDSAWNRYKDYCFAFNDPVVAGNVYLRHYRFCREIIPVVSWLETNERRSVAGWEVCHDRKIIFITENITPQVLYQAKQVDGYIAHIERYYDKVETQAPHETLLRYQEAAVYWRDFFESWAKKESFFIVDHFLKEFSSRYNVLADELIMSTGSSRLIKKLVRFERVRLKLQKNAYVVNHNQGWFLEYEDQTYLISEIKFHIQRIEYHFEDVFYLGDIIFRDEVHSFRANAFVFEKNTKEFLIDFALKHGLGRPRFGLFLPIEVNFIDIALAFVTPSISKVKE